MSDLVINVRQIGNYAAQSTVLPSDLLLIQRGGIGGQYLSVDAQALVATALEQGGPLGVGVTPPAGAAGASIYTGDVVLPVGGELEIGGGAFTYQPTGFQWAINSAPFMALSNAGALSLSAGTLTVARDPAGALEVATAGWVGRVTVGSFNGRRGAVTLTPGDIYAALCLDSPIATQAFVCDAIKGGVEMLLRSHPFVFGWNGRTGDVWLTLADITCVFMQPGQQPIAPTPPADSNDNSIATTAWIHAYIGSAIQDEIASLGLATEAWVLANTVNSFNGRQGIVNLTLTDVTNVGGAPINSPGFSGVPNAPTAPPGTATPQLATCAFVQAAIAASVAGVSSFNTRTGAVTLTLLDVTTAGAAPLSSPSFLGTPQAPTAAIGTATNQLATTAFVANAIAAVAAGVTSFNTRTGAVTLIITDIIAAGGAPIASPTFTGVPAAPTAANGTNTTQIATTAFVISMLNSLTYVATFNGRSGAVTFTENDLTAAGGIVNPNAALTGVPTAPTADPGDNSNTIATTAFVENALTTITGVSTFNGRNGAVVLTLADVTGVGGAPIQSPAFTGVPTADTAAAGTSTTQLATTQFVMNAVAGIVAGVSSFNTRSGAVTLTAGDITGAGGALLASPALSGTPTAPTAAAGTSTTQIATTAFVMAALAASNVTSFNGRTGAVTLGINDITAAGGAPTASPTFSGTPSAPTAANGTDSTQLATTAFVQNAIANVPPGITVSATAPTPAVQGAGWYNLNDGQTYIYTGTTWAIAVNPPVPDLANYAQLSGATFTGPVTLPQGSTVAGYLPLTGGVLGNPGGLTVQGQLTASANFLVAGSLTAQTDAGVGANLTVNGQIIGQASCQIANNLTVSGIPYANQANFTVISDPSVKAEVGPYRTGLAALLALEPIMFRYNGAHGSPADPATTRRIGLDARAAGAVMPELAQQHPTIAGLLTLDTGPLLFALTNAIKQLVSRIETLEATARVTPTAAEIA